MACSNWQAQRGRGSKALQDSVDAAITGGLPTHQTVWLLVLLDAKLRCRVIQRCITVHHSMHNLLC